MIFSAEIGKKVYLLSADSVLKAGEILSFYHRDKEMKITESSLPEQLTFRIGDSVIHSFLKIKDTTISFSTENGINGKVDISLLPIELTKALP